MVDQRTPEEQSDFMKDLAKKKADLEVQKANRLAKEAEKEAARKLQAAVNEPANLVISEDDSEDEIDDEIDDESDDDSDDENAPAVPALPEGRKIGTRLTEILKELNDAASVFTAGGAFNAKKAMEAADAIKKGERRIKKEVRRFSEIIAQTAFELEQLKAFAATMGYEVEPEAAPVAPPAPTENEPNNV